MWNGAMHGTFYCLAPEPREKYPIFIFWSDEPYTQRGIISHIDDEDIYYTVKDG